MRHSFRPHEGAVFRLERIGEEKLPLLIIDDAMAAPDELLAFASGATFTEEKGPGNHFPGVRAPLPESYARAVEALVAPHLDHFGLAGHGPGTIALNTLQMVTRPAAGLNLPQRLPHFDTFENHQLAALHYLGSAGHHGTDFYRHRSTGMERITPERFHPYTQQLVGEVKARGAPAGYMQGSNEFFERTASVEARFNRIAVYFSNTLHSGRIVGTGPFPSAPEEGRLMASVFLRYGDPAQP